ncbi:MAG: CARDB domain-containing protein, partial [Sciscionella sp.]
MRSARLRVASAAAVLLAVLLPALFLPAASAARSSANDRTSWDSWGAEFDRTVHGDFSTIGNTVTTCPPGRRARVCRESEQGHADDGGLPALNNGNTMVWTDVDGDPDTYDSSRGQLSIPAGSRIAFAKLTWGGDLRAGSVGQCGRSASWPAGSPERQAVSLTVGAKPTVSITPGRFAIDEDSAAPFHAEDRWYSAHADVTNELAGVRGGEPSTVTVGNIWTGKGRDCFGGWSLVVVWAYDGSDAQHAPAKKHVVVYDGHLRVPTGGTLLSLAAPDLRAAGSLTRIGVTAYEGDRALAGDALLVNGRAQEEHSIHGERENFFVSDATGALDPRHVNNMSVDAKSFDVSGDAVRSGEDSDDPTVLSFTGTRDSYLVQSIAASFAKPELSVSTSTNRPATHAGERVTQTALVRNSGGAPAEDVTVHLDIGAGCDRRIGTLDAGETASVSCTGVAGDRDYGVTATVTATSAGGDKLSAWARRPVRVLHPALRAELRVSPHTVVPGEPLNYAVVLHNEGDTALSGISLHGNDLVACRRNDLDALPPAASRTVRCSTDAGQRGGSGTVTVSGQDELGRRVSDSASTSFT